MSSLRVANMGCHVGYGSCMQLGTSSLLTAMSEIAACKLRHTLLRWLQIKEIPEGMYYNGRGPLFSARLADLDIMWQRAYQLMAVCKEVRIFLDCKIGAGFWGGYLHSCKVVHLP